MFFLARIAVSFGLTCYSTVMKYPELLVHKSVQKASAHNLMSVDIS